MGAAVMVSSGLACALAGALALSLLAAPAHAEGLAGAAQEAPLETGLVDPSGSTAIIDFSALSFAAQVAVLEAYCTALSSGIVVFTCDDELQYVTGLQAPGEAVQQLVDLANVVLVNMSSDGTNLDPEHLISAVVSDAAEGPSDMTDDEAMATYFSSMGLSNLAGVRGLVAPLLLRQGKGRQNSAQGHLPVTTSTTRTRIGVESSRTTMHV